MDWAKFGAGSVDAEVLEDVLGRAGHAPTAPAADWSLAALVRMLDYEPKNKPFLVGDPTLLEGTQELLDMSPARATEARWLLKEFAPCHDPRYSDPDTIGGCFGCKTDDIADFGFVYSSKTSLVGFVEGIVSSLANWKIYAVGMTHHVWTDELITTPTGATFEHPLRPLEAVSAGTVIHTLYCAAHLSEWYKHVLAAAPATKGARYRHDLWAGRISIGIEQAALIYPTTTVDGQDFLDALVAWGRELNQTEV